MTCERSAAAPVTGSPLPDEAWMCALASLPGMTPARLCMLLERRSAADAFEAVCADRLRPGPAPVVVDDARHGEQTARSWSSFASSLDVAACWERHRRAGVGVTSRAAGTLPAGLGSDLEPPEILFHRGSLDHLAGARAAIVGTRRCSAYGRQVAYQLARDLASAGVGVVSGLAAGIDAAAHEGTLAAEAAPAIAVVGTGADRPYPRRAASLWSRVAEAGLLLTEHPLGTEPRPWHFPVRNRLIAALSDVVVVVESRSRGGALITVNEADRRNRTVMAVPGPVIGGASAGTNDLLADGAGVVRGADDVLAALGMTPGARRSSIEPRSKPAGDAAVVLEALGWQPATLDQLTLRTTLNLDAAVLAVEHLRRSGWVTEQGGWIEQCPRPHG